MTTTGLGTRHMAAAADWVETSTPTGRLHDGPLPLVQRCGPELVAEVAVVTLGLGWRVEETSGEVL